ncbi:hypothetical protein P4475_13370 [Halalkalibacterium halodurans]|uniref:hypothetical protein n=1 Tax=Halalkalibacterium halodurans TaxID=86665 RepID=UPI002E2466D7|nr:hypothetical protein [Halalkalibacterium halodurans]
MTRNESKNFYFLVKECGISPLDIPHMTKFQKEILIAQHNEMIEQQKKEAEKVEKQRGKSVGKTKRRRRR